MTDLTHLDAAGNARMVDITGKDETERSARASGNIRMKEKTFNAIRNNELAKGDALAVARVAGIQAAKRAADLIPLCHSLPLTDVRIEVELDEALPGLRVEATVRTRARTGVEMEAMVAVSVTLITVYDMAKGNDKEMVISDIQLLEKQGGKSGHWQRRAV